MARRFEFFMLETAKHYKASYAKSSRVSDLHVTDFAQAPRNRIKSKTDFYQQSFEDGDRLAIYLAARSAVVTL